MLPQSENQITSGKAHLIHQANDFGKNAHTHST